MFVIHKGIIFPTADKYRSCESANGNLSSGRTAMEIVTSNQIKDHNSFSGVIFMDEKYHKSMTLVKMRNKTRNGNFYIFLCYT